MAKKDGPGKQSNPSTPTAPSSRAVTPSLIERSPRSSSDAQPIKPTQSPQPAEPSVTEHNAQAKDRREVEALEDTPTSEPVSIPALALPDQGSTPISLASTPPRGSLDELPTCLPSGDNARLSDISDIAQNEDRKFSRGYEKAMAELQAAHDASELRWQEELHSYLERIDALQTKVQYLAKEAAETAKHAATIVQAGSAERKLLEKDERIAVLMEEGQKLSKTELKQMTTIKKLRSQVVETTKTQTEMERRADKAERDLANIQDKVKRAEAAEKRLSERLQTSSKMDQAFNTVSGERDALRETVSDMRAQVARAIARADTAEEKVQNNAVEQARKRMAELQDDLTSTKLENELSEEKLRREIRDLKEDRERETEKAKMLQIEHQGEVSNLESQLEALRSRAEEVTSSTTGDAQAKLLRQIETLQTQYAAASENWQGIESSLLSRLANVEKERDEITQREGDVRRKLREAAMKAKKLEGEYENSADVCQGLEMQLTEQQEQQDRLRRKAKQTESELLAAKQDLAQEHERTEGVISQRLEEEKVKWRELASPSPIHALHNDWPVTSLRKSSGLELLNLSTASIDRPHSRRPSGFAMHAHGSGTPPRLDSLPPYHQTPANGVPETPSIRMIDHDEFFSTGPATPASPAHTHRGINDLISVSTVGAGPSVQLVERMSATVRRLESERAASKDELARLGAQRDEARNEVVELMREVELKKAGDERVAKLEVQQEEMEERYQTTLEMLGEKSEQVEELKADVADVKQMYRDLVDSTMK